MTQALVHVSSEGERWDKIADRYYGDPYRYVEIIEANPTVPIYAVLPAGVRISIPVITEAQTLVDLPPWKR